VNSQLWSIGLIVLSATAFGAMPLFAGIAYNSGVTPLTLLFLRFAIGAALLHIWMWARSIPYPGRSACGQLLWIGGVGFVLQSICFFTAIKFANPALVVVLLYSYPTLVTVVETMFWRVPLTARKAVAIVLTSIGAVLTAATALNAQPLGVVLALLAAIVYAGYVLLSSHIMQREAPLPSCSVIFTAAALVFGGLVQTLHQQLPTTSTAWAGTIGVAGCSIVAIVSLFAGIQRLGAARAALLSTLEPVIAMVLVSVVTGQLLTSEQLVGGGLIIGGAVSLSKPS